jgi:hypothetical protein
MEQAMEISLKLGATTLHGKVTTTEKENEFLYTFNLDGIPLFTIHLSDDGCWVSDNSATDPLLVMLAGDAIENMEDFTDVLMELDSIRDN